ncbi:MAG: hydroxyacid dehydrogenase [Lachnospiraceae bacterium]|nr:hydroxyacid dehydrogenase [Lachnospiraceae bacterium]
MKGIGKQKKGGEMMKVFLCETIHDKAVELLRENGEIIGDWARIGEVDALISRAIKIGRAEMDKMPNLKVIAVHGTGTDDIDLQEAKKRGIQVVYAPHLNANAVAELSVGLMLSVCRKIVEARKVIEGFGDASGKPGSERQAIAQSVLRGTELRGKTCGLIGFGAIATKIADIVRYGFGMDVVAYSPSLTEERAAEHGSRPAATIEEVLKVADVVCLSLPLNEKTRGMMSAERLGMMKSGAILINTSRGPLVDEEALYQALKGGTLGGAACDVFCEGFPTMGNPLLELPNFVATPHIGANTDEALYTVGMACAVQIVDVLAGKEPEYPVYIK